MAALAGAENSSKLAMQILKSTYTQHVRTFALAVFPAMPITYLLSNLGNNLV